MSADLLLFVALALQEPEHRAVGYDGFFVRSADGANELVVEGLFQVLFAYHGRYRDPSTDVELKRFRPELSGRLARSLRFRFEPKFLEDEVELEESWIGVDLCGGDALLMLGRMKAPFGLEEVRSRRHIDFPTFSILNQFSPAEDHGAFLNGTSASGCFEYGVAAYNGTGTSDTTSSKDVALRAMVHPLAGRAGDAELQLGAAVTFGSQDEPIAGETIDNEVGLPVVVFAPGVALDGTRTRVGVEAAWFSGPWFAQGELLYLTQQLGRAGANRAATAAGAYLTVARTLTGERKTFAGVEPARPNDFDTRRGPGAWVLAARYSELRLDHTLDPFAVPGTFTPEIKTASLALNWIPNRHAIVRHALVWSDYHQKVFVGGDSTDGELAFVIETQLHF
jgi:phosphate-selective porin